MITYRTAVPADAPALAQLRGVFLLEAGGVPSDAERLAMEPLFRAYFQASLEDGSFVAWLALEDENIVATSGIVFYAVPPTFDNRSGKTAYIMNMFTLPGYRRRGIAGELFRRTVGEAKARGCGKITLHATCEGRPLYEQFGFREVPGDMEFFP